MNEVNNSMNPLNQNQNQYSRNNTNNLNNSMGYNNNMLNNQQQLNNSMNFVNGNIPNNYSNYNNQQTSMNNMLNNGQQTNQYNENTFGTSTLENQTNNMYSQLQVNDNMNTNMSNNSLTSNDSENSMNDITNNIQPMNSRMDKYNTTNLDNTSNDINNDLLNNNQSNNMNTNMMENNQFNNTNNSISNNTSINDMSNDIPIINNQNQTPTNNNNNNPKQKDDTEAYFADAKKKGFPIWIILLILFLVVIGGGVYYFMVIDTPKNIFGSILNDKLFGIKLEDYEKTTIDFEASAKFMSSDESMMQVFDIINKISIKGSLGEDYQNKTFFMNLEPMYESKELLKMNAYYENNSMYIELKDIYDKVLKSELSKDAEINDDIFENDNKEYTEKFILSLKKHLTETFKDLQNKKEYVKLDKNYVKKVSIIIESQNLIDLYKNLLNDSDFIESASKLTETSQSEIKESLESEIEYMEEYKEDYEPLKISLYLSIITNKFYKLEMTDEEIMITVDAKDNVFSYKLYDEDDIIQMQGEFSLVKNNETDYELFFTIDLIEEQVSMEFNIDYSVKYNEDIQTLPTTDAVDINTLSEADTNKIITNISENENINKFIEDISSLYSYGMTGDEDYLA